METLTFPTTAGALGQLFGAEVIGSSEAQVRSLVPLSNASEGCLTFISHKKFDKLLEKLPGGVVLTSSSQVRSDLPLTFIVVPDPQRAFAEIARRVTARPSWPGISPQAVVSGTAVLGKDVSIAPFAVLADGVTVGDGTVIHPFVSIGQNARIGKNSEIHPQATIGEKVVIGDRVKIFAGSVIGSDGFGLIPPSAGNNGGILEMPQIGTVVIEDDVRIGAKCTVDRATLGETRIGRGTKIDDQVHIAHNCRIGAHVVLCAQVGIAGSTTLEDGVVLGGQVGVSNGITIVQGARLAAQSGVGMDIREGGDYFGSPAVPMKEAIKSIKYFRKLPEIWRRLKAVEERLIETEK
jgi:UDP-3-O-[3-hydroxymyristoyl] glucosamine N-acyltransferase